MPVPCFSTISIISYNLLLLFAVIVARKDAAAPVNELLLYLVIKSGLF
jgi:hypothetical protein